MNPILTAAKQLLHKEEKGFIYFKNVHLLAI